MKQSIVIGTIFLIFTLAAHAANRTGSIVFAQASPPEVCTQIYQPVCGTDESGKRVTYSNACFARVAKATNVTPGECIK
jgi:Kazal-type serine protease inhibitor domain